MCGFSNALAFTEIDENDIDYVENNIRIRWANATKNQQSNDNTDNSISNQNIDDFFGKNYVGRSSQFQFERGERVLIRQLVAHVKCVVKTKGYDRFKYKVPKSTLPKGTNKGRSRRKIDSQSILKINNDALQVENNTNNTIDETLHMKLKESLFKRVQVCLQQYSVDDFLLETLDDNIVEVFKKGAKTYGRIVCVIFREENAKDQEPKAVSYYESERSNYWVLSNFIEHLKKHGCKLQDGVKRKRLKLQKKDAPIKKNDSTLNAEENEIVEIVDVPIYIEAIDDDSVVIVNEQISNGDVTSNKTDSSQLFNQLANHITEIVTENLTNGDVQEQMNFKLNKTQAYLTVTNIPPDGNCLFGSLVHQIHKHIVTSIEHQNETKTLRALVCEHILMPENFKTYKRTLENYLFDNKKKEEMKDITTECQMYVHNVLSRDGQWAGAEAIHAVSDIYKVNIIVFIEDDICYMHSYNQTYGITIAIAYRKGNNPMEGGQYNHYESVSDMNADTIYNVTDLLMKSIK